MFLPKIIVIAVLLLVLLAGRRMSFFLNNKYIFAVIVVLGVLGVIFSDSIYSALNGKVMTYVQAPGSDDLPFIPERWKNTGLKNPDDNTRDRMISDLTMHKRFVGNNKTGIIDMLGEPEGTHNFPEWDMEYYLGPSHYGSGARWLVFKFDAKDEVTDFTIQGQ